MLPCAYMKPYVSYIVSTVKSNHDFANKNLENLESLVIVSSTFEVSYKSVIYYLYDSFHDIKKHIRVWNSLGIR